MVSLYIWLVPACFWLLLLTTMVWWFILESVKFPKMQVWWRRRADGGVGTQTLLLLNTNRRRSGCNVTNTTHFCSSLFLDFVILVLPINVDVAYRLWLAPYETDGNYLVLHYINFIVDIFIFCNAIILYL